MIPLNQRSLAALVHDVVAAVIAWCGAYWLRFNLEIPPSAYLGSMLASLTWVVPGQIALFVGFGLYRGIWRYASVPDLRRIVLVALLSAAAISIVVVIFRELNVPRSVVLIDPLLVLCTVVGLSVEDLSEAGGPFLGVEGVEFHRPFYPGDTLTARSTVVSKRDSESRPTFGIVTWETEGRNQRGEIVLNYRRTNLVAKKGAR